MKGRSIGTAVVCAVCAFLIVSAFFAKDFILYDYHMNVPDYSYTETKEGRPLSADTSVWFSYGDAGKAVYYGVNEEGQEDRLTVYALTQTGEISVTKGNDSPIRQDSLGHFIAALPMTEQDIDGDGKAEKVYDYARADFGLNAFNPSPQRFLTEEMPFELVFAERKYIMVYHGLLRK